MELIEYAELVDKVRNQQKKYFQTRSSIDLNLSKKFEKNLDEATENILGPNRIKNQQSLF